MKENIMSDNSLEEIELSIEEAKKMVTKANSLKSLLSNKNYKALVDEGYFKEEAIRLVLLKSDPNMESETNQKAIIQAIDGIGSFRQYLHTVLQYGAMAEKEISAAQEAREELLAEEL
jgi:hypothetical protein